ASSPSRPPTASASTSRRRVRGMRARAHPRPAPSSEILVAGHDLREVVLAFALPGAVQRLGAARGELASVLAERARVGGDGGSGAGPGAGPGSAGIEADRAADLHLPRQVE